MDLEHCPNCGGALSIIAAILESTAIAKILRHLGLSARAPPRSPARHFALLSKPPESHTETPFLPAQLPEPTAPFGSHSRATPKRPETWRLGPVNNSTISRFWTKNSTSLTADRFSSSFPYQKKTRFKFLLAASSHRRPHRDVGQMGTCNTRVVCEVFAMLFGCLLLWHGSQSYAQTPTQLPDGLIVGKYFWFIPLRDGNGTATPGVTPTAVRGATSQEAFDKFIQALVPKPGLTLINNGCVYLGGGNSHAPFDVFNVPSWRETVGDEITGQICTTYFEGGTPWPLGTAVTEYGAYRCNWRSAGWGGPISVSDESPIEPIIQVTCPHGFAIWWAEPGIQGVCRRVRPHCDLAENPACRGAWPPPAGRTGRTGRAAPACSTATSTRAGRGQRRQTRYP